MRKRIDRPETLFDWDRALSFLVVADEGSLSAAARVLDLSQPTVGRQMAALEEELGVTLFERVGRGLEITPTGLDLVEHIRAMADSAQRVARVAAGHSLELEGTVVLSAGEIEAIHWLPAMAREIRRRHPGIFLEILATNQTSDLRKRQADIALRNYHPEDPELIATKVREGRGFLYATPDYLAALGNPTTPAGFSEAEFIGFDRTGLLLRGLNGFGFELTEKSFPYVSPSQPLQWELVKQGAGVGVMIEEVGDQEARVVRALPDLVLPVPIWLTTHREVRTSRRVRAVFDILVEELTKAERACRT